MTDRFTVRAVVIMLGAATLTGLLGLIILVFRGQGDVATLAVIAGPTGTALGALATVLAHTGTAPSHSDPPATTPALLQPASPAPSGAEP